MAGGFARLTGDAVPLLAAALPRYAARQHQAVGRTMAQGYGLRFFLFEADGTLRRLPLRTLQGMVRDEDRMP